MTLYGLAQNESLVQERDLIRRLHCKSETLTLWREELEQLGLVRSFYHTHLELVLLKPLSPQEFLSHHIYSRLFASVCSQETFSIMKERYRPRYSIDISKEVSKSFDMRRLSAWSASEEERYHEELRDRTNAYDFDAVSFFKGFSLFPAHLISEELLVMIGEYGSFYKMNFVDMKSVLMDTIKFDKTSFDKHRFEKLLLDKYGKTSIDDVSDPSELDPMSYLVYRQGHDYVSAAERNAIMSIERDYAYGNEIANKVIDYILKGDSKQINKGYIDYLVQPMKRLGLENADEVESHLNSLQTSFAKRNQPVINNVVSMPDYTEESEDDPEELEKLRKAFSEVISKKGDN